MAILGRLEEDGRLISWRSKWRAAAIKQPAEMQRANSMPRRALASAVFTLIIISSQVAHADNASLRRLQGAGGQAPLAMAPSLPASLSNAGQSHKRQKKEEVEVPCHHHQHWCHWQACARRLCLRLKKCLLGSLGEPAPAAGLPCSLTTLLGARAKQGLPALAALPAEVQQ